MQSCSAALSLKKNSITAPKRKINNTTIQLCFVHQKQVHLINFLSEVVRKKNY